ncbi:MAG: hypothetical protein ABIQ99_05410 [Thermoflexales bacterium]
MTSPARDPATMAPARGPREFKVATSTLALVLLGFIACAQALWLPFSASDLPWVSGPATLQMLTLAPDGLFLPGLMSGDAPVMMRLIRVGAHLIVALLIAQSLHGRWRQTAALALLLGSPVAYRAVSWMPALGPQVAAALIVTGVALIRRRRRGAGASIALVGAIWLGLGLFVGSAELRDLAAAAGLWMAIALVATLAIEAIRTHRLSRLSRPAHVLTALAVPALALSGALTSAGWLRGATLALAPVRSALNLANDRGKATTVVLLNSPTWLAAPNTKPTAPAYGDWLLPTGPLAPAPSAGNLTLRVARTPDLVLTRQYALGGLIAYYDGAIMMERTQALTEALAADALILSPYGAKIDEDATVVWRRIAPASPPLARFESPQGVVALLGASACLDPAGALWVRTALRVDAIAPAATGKLFRHALALADSDPQLAGNDAPLMGGLAELADLPIGVAFEDLNVFEAKRIPAAAVRLGIYDWKTGARWRSTSGDSAGDTQLPGDAWVAPVDFRPSCNSR